MTREEAVGYLKMMTAIFKGNPLSDSKLAYEEYIKVLSTIELDLMQQVYDDLARLTKFFPTISELYETYKSVKAADRENKKFIQPDTTCYICEGKGFIMHQKKQKVVVQGKEIFIPLNFILYCPECDKGTEFKYQGRDCKKDKSDYYTETISKYFDIEELRAKNMFKPRRCSPMPENLKQKIRKLGMRI